MTVPIITRAIESDRYWYLLAALLLAAVVLLVYGPSLGYGFTFFDDYDLLSFNGMVGGAHPGLMGAFSNDVFVGSSSFYRPLLTVSLLIDARIGNGDPRVFHATNLLFHLLACIALLALLRSFGTPRPLALAGSCLFAAHPALTMAVAWIPGRNDLMLALFVLLACVSLVRYLKSYASGWFALHAVAVAAAMFTKENGAVAVAAYIAITMLVVGFRASFRWRHLPLLSVWTVLLACWYLLRESAVGLHWMYTAHWLQPTQAFVGLLAYTGKLFWPANLRPFPGIGRSDPVVGIVAITVFIIVALASRVRDRRLFAIGIFWYLLFLLPSTAMQYMKEQLFLEHRQYLAAAGLLLAASQLDLVRRIDLRRWQTVVITALLLTALGLKSAVYERTFTNGTVFWKTAIMTSPGSAFAHSGYSRVLALRGEKQQALEYMCRAIELDPDNLDYFNFYMLLQSQFGPDTASAGRPKGGTAAGQQRRPAPENLLAEAVRMHREWKIEQAMALYRWYLRDHPRDAQVHYMLGMASMANKDWEQAAISFYQAIALGVPGDERSAAFDNLSTIYLMWGMVRQSAEARDSAKAMAARR